jgi:hypothetical protein
MAAPAVSWPLGTELSVVVFALLPPADRLHARAVCRDWRRTLSDPALWRALDVSWSPDPLWPPLWFADDEAVPPRAVAVTLFAAAARADRRLRELDASGCVPRLLRFERLLQAVRANSCLRVLRVLDCGSGGHECSVQPCAAFTPENLKKLLNASYARRLEADLRCTAAEAARLLHTHPELRIRRLCVVERSWGNIDTEACATALLAVLRDHGPLTQLGVTSLKLSEARVTEIVDVAIARCLTVLRLDCCELGPGHLTPLARLVRAGLLTELMLRDEPVVNPPEIGLFTPVTRTGWVALCAAVKASTSLRSLTTVRLLNTARWAALQLFAAVTGHPTLREVCVSGITNIYGWPNDLTPDDARAQQRVNGRALGRIIAANAPALLSLRFEDCFLGQAGLAAALLSLAANTHLQLLGVWCSCRQQEEWQRPPQPRYDDLVPARLSEAFIEQTMRPALARSVSLRRLMLVPHDEALPDEEDACTDGCEETRRVRAQLAALAQEVASRAGDAGTARGWARCARRWALLTAAATAERERA